MTIAYRAPSHPGMGYPRYVEPKPPRHVDAPADSGSSSSLRLPDPSAFPRVDDQRVRPETREELVRGRSVLAMPAKAQHGDRHHAIDFLTGGCIAPGYVGSCDLLTRVGEGSDFATDTCIRREGIDPATGARHLEELAFEIVAEQSLRDVTERARELSNRGVRRIIAIFVKKDEVREWSRELDDWSILDANGTLEDRTLTGPIPVRALLDRAEATRAVVRALYAQQNPAILEIKAEGLAQGITILCTALGIPLDADRRAHLQSLDTAGLEALLTTIGTQHRWP
jgi:hypothetical protein